MIDFHTHIFPEKIAKGTLDFLQSRCKTAPHTNGMAEGLLASASEAGIDCSIVLPVVTNPSQFLSVNTFASQFREKPLLSFGGIHPDSGSYKEDLRTIKSMGFRGIKIHPDYQETFINDIRYKRIISYATELGLIISVHAGFDPGYPDCVHCPPDFAAEVIDEVRPEKLVLAHMGGFLRWDEVEEHLVGRNLYLDTAVVFGIIKDEQFLRICRNHGTDRILFATDSPWASQKAFVDYFKGLDMPDKDKELILHENATKLLTL